MEGLFNSQNNSAGLNFLIHLKDWLKFYTECFKDMNINSKLDFKIIITFDICKSLTCRFTVNFFKVNSLLK